MGLELRHCRGGDSCGGWWKEWSTGGRFETDGGGTSRGRGGVTKGRGGAPAAAMGGHVTSGRWDSAVELLSYYRVGGEGSAEKDAWRGEAELIPDIAVLQTRGLWPSMTRKEN